VGPGLGGDGDNIQVNGGGDDHAVVMVGVVADDLASARNGEERDVVVCAILRGKRVQRGYIAAALASDATVAVERGKKRVIIAVRDCIYIVLYYNLNQPPHINCKWQIGDARTRGMRGCDAFEKA
jgi:hypothetical protein